MSQIVIYYLECRGFIEMHICWLQGTRPNFWSVAQKDNNQDVT